MSVFLSLSKCSSLCLSPLTTDGLSLGNQWCTYRTIENGLMLIHGVGVGWGGGSKVAARLWQNQTHSHSRPPPPPPPPTLICSANPFSPPPPIPLYDRFGRIKPILTLALSLSLAPPPPTPPLAPSLSWRQLGGHSNPFSLSPSLSRPHSRPPPSLSLSLSLSRPLSLSYECSQEGTHVARLEPLHRVLAAGLSSLLETWSSVLHFGSLWIFYLQ